MTSSILAGERKWTSARRGGMTVLGKVAVPKPVNLPSQRLENHGLDPNVEIVPKGTYSWGSRSSSLTSNAWGSSTLSPKTDGGSASPSHLSGRPSSGGSGTRPSTAGSDKTHEPVANAWDSHSRPSSASGALTSNHTLHMSLRPHSAETRPSSLHLSRFAEPLSDNSIAWSATGTTEKLGPTSSKVDGFSLTSGDFPTLGSEKETSGTQIDSLEHGSHGHPGLSSGVVEGKEGTRNSVGNISGNANTEVGNADAWRRDNPIYGQDGARPSAEKWQADFQPYANPAIPSQHYDAWHGPPVNNYPGGTWYQQPSGGPPFGPPAGPGGFPMEPFPYYQPQIPSTGLPNRQSFPPLRAGPRGPHQKIGDMYRPPIHDAYIHPGMPPRPGFYPGPASYKGYYGPSMGYCNTSERDIPLTGMAMSPPAAYRYSGQTAPDLCSPHSRSSGNGPVSKSVISEQADFGHPQDSQGPYKVLLKQHDGCDGKDEQKWDEPMMSNSNPREGDFLRNSLCSWENGCRADHKEDEEFDRRRMAHGEEVLDGVENQGDAPLNVKTSERIGIFKSSDDISVKKFEQGGSVLPEVSRAPKDPNLIQKIEGLNAKAWASDGRTDTKSISSREEQKNKLQACNARVIHSTNEAVMGSGSLEETHLSGIMNTASHEDYAPSGVRNFESTASRRSIHGIDDMADHHSKRRFSAQEADGWWRRSHVTNTSRGVLASYFEASCAVQGQTHNTEVTEKSGFFPQQNDDGESVPPVTASSDSHAQRAKMKELAEQRRKQREKEEEERTRDLKAKALAKLKELNRRTQAGEGSMAKLEATPIGALEDTQEELSSPAQLTIVAGKSKEACSAVVSNTNAVAHDGEGSVITRLDKSTSLNTESPLQIAKTFYKEPVLLDQLELLQQEPLELDVNNADSSNPNSTPCVNGIRAFRQKQKGYRQKQNNSLESYSTEKPIFSPIAEGLKEHANVAANVPLSIESVGKEIPLNSELSSPVNSSVTVEFSAHQRRKGKSGKNKQPVEEALSTVVSPSLASKDTVLEILTERNKSKTSEPMWDPTSAQSGTNSKNASQSSEQHVSLSNEETQIRINNHWKSQHSRRLPRNSQAKKLAEKFHTGDAVVWAPVRPQNKTEISDEGSPNSAVETVGPSTKNDHQVQNNPRNKRAEMERYIPKPVAKEMAQQGSGHQVVAPPVSQITSDPSGRTQSGSLGTESTQSFVTSVGKAVSTVESRNGDGRHNKSSKEHESWCQQSSGESIDSSLCRNSQKMIEHHQSQKMYARSVKGQSKYSDGWNTSDGWNVPEDSGTAVIVPVGKDQGVTARGKWQPYKGHKSAGHNRGSDEKKISSGDREKIQSSVTETCQAEVLVTSKESRAARELLTTHWQPKSHPFSGTNRQGSRPYGSQNVSDEVGRANKPTLQAAMSVPLKAEKETAVVRDERPQHDQSLPDKSKSKQVLSVEYLEAKKETNMDTHKGLPRNPVEPSPLNMDFQHECISSGFRKSGNQNSRFEQDSKCDCHGSGRDNKQHNATVNRERQKRTSHFGHQPVGRNSTTRANNFEPPKDVSHDSSPRIRERVQGHLRHGGVSFHGRQSGNV